MAKCNLSQLANTVLHYTVLTDYNDNNLPLYIGRAIPGSATTDSVWEIKKVIYDELLNPIEVAYTDGNASFSNRWTDRTTLNYS